LSSLRYLALLEKGLNTHTRRLYDLHLNFPATSPFLTLRTVIIYLLGQVGPRRIGELGMPAALIEIKHLLAPQKGIKKPLATWWGNTLLGAGVQDKC
jgi:hypothetical protein